MEADLEFVSDNSAIITCSGHCSTINHCKSWPEEWSGIPVDGSSLEWVQVTPSVLPARHGELRAKGPPRIRQD